MNWRDIHTVYRKELLEALRDRRALISMILVPLLIIPALTFGLNVFAVRLFARAQSEAPDIMLLGAQQSPKIQSLLRNYKLVRLVPARSDYASLVSTKKLRAALELPADFDARVERGESAVPAKIYFYEGELRSVLAAKVIESFLREVGDNEIQERLLALGLSADLVRPLAVERRNVAAPQQVRGNLFGSFVPCLIIVFCLIGATYPTLDMTVGEKERGTLETLLCTPVGRREIVVGKFLLALTAALLTTACSFAASVACLSFLGVNASARSPAAGSVGMLVLPSSVFAGSVLLALPEVVFITALLFSLSIFARSYKEAQSYASPLVFLVLVPIIVGLLPGVELSWPTALVPILNVTLASRDHMSGVYAWHLIALSFISSCLYAAAALATAFWLFQREEVLFRH